ncbi:bacterioferritin, partial [Pseudomonas sp. CrR25]|nr:bacterioferritin [Pseudomonas sp. CrR25]
DQYFVHSRLYADWGFGKLYERINHEMEEETQHADALLQRILFLEGVPDMAANPFSFGQNVPQMLRLDLALEYEVRAALSKGIELCERYQDYQSRDILLAQLKDTEEDHAYWLEIQLQLIDTLGLENYLQAQI